MKRIPKYEYENKREAHLSSFKFTMYMMGLFAAFMIAGFFFSTTLFLIATVMAVLEGIMMLLILNSWNKFQSRYYVRNYTKRS